MNKSSRIIEKIKSVFPDETINELSKETGFVKRIRKIKPAYFLWSLVLGFSFGTERNISNFRRVYERISEQHLVPSAFYDRFHGGLVVFLHKLLLMSLDTLKTAWFQVDFRLQAFKDILYTDSTIVKLNDKLAKLYPGTRTNHSPASAKVHALFSVKGKGKSTIQLSSGREHDKKKLTIGSWCKDRLLLFDLGYYSYHLFSKIDKYKGYFISRLKENANPVIVSVSNSSSGKTDALVGKSLRYVLLTSRREVLDVEVELHFKNRKYNGKQNKASKVFRLVAIRNQEIKTYHCYLTNVPNDFLTAAEDCQLLSVSLGDRTGFQGIKIRLSSRPSAI